MKNNVNRNFRFGFFVSLILLLAGSLASYYTINKLIDSSGLVDHTHQVLIASEDVISNIKDGETGQRGYLLTRQTDFLEPYVGAYDRTMQALNKVKELTRDNPQQQNNCDTLDKLIRSRFAILDQSIEDIKGNLPLNIFRLRDGQAFMSQVRLMVKKIQRIEENLLYVRTEQQNKFVRFAPIAIVLSTLIAIIVTIIFFRKVADDSKDKAEMAETLLEKDQQMSERVSIIGNLANKLASGDYTIRLNAEQNDTLGTISGALNKMAGSLEETFTRLNQDQWLQTGGVKVSEQIVGEKSLTELSNDSINTITEYVEADMGAIYLVDSDHSLYIAGSSSLPQALKNLRILPGDGLAGQCFIAKKEIWIKELQDEFYTTFSSGVIKPRELLLYPIFFEGRAIGVIELGTTGSFKDIHREYLRKVSELLGVSINSAYVRMRLNELLEETQAQSEELQAQHRELENMNAELEVQAEKLQTSEEELKVQQEELMETNQELEERSRQLEEKNHLVVLRNLDIQKKAEELEQSTRYKSEFLANMSHELRTPLNSILLLSRLLHENSSSNLSEEQIEYAQVIQSSGHGLLELIDEILDLSKIEAGKLLLEYERIAIQDIMQDMRMMFGPMATDKKLVFEIFTDPGVPAVLETDKMRVEQILKNLISNSLKFTTTGKIELKASMSKKMDNTIVFTVSDTGIGIAEDKQKMIFEAFQQADGSTKRKYGGTGLGLSISRQLARLLQGEIELESEIGKGSSFSLSIPLFKPGQLVVAPKLSVVPSIAEPELLPVQKPSPYLAESIPASVPDDRDNIEINDKVILVVEDDVNFAKALVEYTRQKKYKAIHIVRGDEVLETALKYKPMGILLDIQLPVKDGLSVMDELKKDVRTRPIPVHIMSSYEVKKESLNRGAVDFINKPVLFERMNSVLEKIEQVVNTERKKVLIVEDNTQHAKALAYYLNENNVNAEISDDINNSIDTLQNREVNCVILDMGIPGKKAYETLETVKQNEGLEHIPIIIFTGQSLSRHEEQRIRQYADAIVVKTAQSYQRILSEVSLFLHLVDNPQERRGLAGKGLGNMEEVLKNKVVLVVDDDVRNIFALTKALEKQKLTVLPAIDGKEGLNILEQHSKIDIVLMDMMMPEMDGYETIRRIRSKSKWKKLPVIAVTAKAMSGDREKCLQAGASDYISKPVDSDQLLSLMRVWLYETV